MKENDLDQDDPIRMLDLYIGKRIREKRLKMGMTLTNLAERMSISHQQIQKYETAQSRLSATTIYQIGEALGVNPAYFYQGFDPSFKKHLIKQHDGIIIPQKDQPLNILLIEDDAGDELLARQAFAECSVAVNLYTVHDGVTAIEFLRHKRLIEGPRPDIILLDLNIPKCDGSCVLKNIKKDPDLCDIPVIVLTNSINFIEMLTCYRLYASGFLCKPFEYNAFVESINSLVQYWSCVVILPNRAHG